MKIFKKSFFLIAIILMIIIFIGVIIKVSLNKNYKNKKIGNNKSIEEIEDYILNIKTYKANLDVTITNNRNENIYKLSQEVTENYEKQKVLEPKEINGLEMTYQNGKLEIKNTNLNLSKIYENYPNMSDNNLFLTSFIEYYKDLTEKSVKIIENNTILMEVKTDVNRYNVEQKLYVDKETLKPRKLEIMDNNNNTKVYILYNEIEINI